MKSWRLVKQPLLKKNVLSAIKNMSQLSACLNFFCKKFHVR